MVVARRVALVAALGVVVGCSVPPSALGGSSAEVTINGEQTGGPHPIVCTQTGWSWIVETPEQENGFTAAFESGGDLSAQSVQINDMAGFSGSFWENTIGQGRASVANGKVRITGTAEGAFTDNPTDEVNATFDIEADC